MQSFKFDFHGLPVFSDEATNRTIVHPPARRSSQAVVSSTSDK
jgi:hypothetical protein